MNETIQVQLNHRSIRKFKPEPISQETVNLLVDVARHTASSSFLQTYSILSITDPAKKQRLAEIGKQSYIAEAGHLFVMVADQYRNQVIAESQGVDTAILGGTDRFMVAASDALLASQNIMVAAESLGLGGVFLGSILNQADEVIQLLDLPEHVVPILGIALGYPDQSPQLKPRLPREVMHFENSYPRYTSILDQLKLYDEVVETYYDLRDTSKRVDKFTKQVANSMTRTHPGRLELLKFYQQQKFLLK